MQSHSLQLWITTNLWIMRKSKKPRGDQRTNHSWNKPRKQQMLKHSSSRKLLLLRMQKTCNSCEKSQSRTLTKFMHQYHDKLLFV